MRHLLYISRLASIIELQAINDYVEPKLIGSRFRVQARPGLRLVAYASESATGCGYEIIFTFYELGLPTAHLDGPGLGQGFKGYNRWTLLTILIKIRNTRHTPLGETAL